MRKHLRARTVAALSIAGLVLTACGSGTARPQRVEAAPAAGDLRSARACTIPDRFAGRDVDRLPVTDKLIALTFDAGANADAVPSIRATLHAMKVKATFFLTGRFVQHYPLKSQRLADRDLVGNHTLTHPDLTTLSDDEIRTEVRSAEQIIRTRTGEDPRRFFRFPYGARTGHDIQLLNSLCYVPFRWTVDTLGWKGTSGGQSVDSVVSRVVAAAQPGAIVLMHVGSNPDDGSTLDADALPQIITRLRALGYHFVRLAWVLDEAP